MAHLGTFLKRLRTDTCGAALVEFAFIAPVLGMMLIGLVDVSMYISSRLTVQRAARAGGEYAVLNTYDATKIAGAISAATAQQSAYMSAIEASPAPTKWCACPDAATGLTAKTCGQKCTSGLTAGTYVTANARSTYSTVFAWPGLARSSTITASSVVRIE